MSTLLLVDDNPDITEGLGEVLYSDDRMVITCNDIQSAELVVESTAVTHVLLDIRFSGPFAFEGLDFISHIRRYSPGCKIILMTGNGSAEIRAEAFRKGASGFLDKPFNLTELEGLLTDDVQ